MLSAVARTFASSSSTATTWLIRQFCLDHGAVGVINRRDFDHWGTMPDTTSQHWGAWAKGTRAFGKAIWDVLGERKNPRIVFEHPGEATLATSGFICDTGGMIVICAGTTGYNVTLDLRYHWIMQKRFRAATCRTTSRPPPSTR